MRIQFTTCLSGPETFIRPGDVVELPEAEALRHVANGNAVAAEPEPAPEKTPEPEIETAVAPPAPEVAAVRPSSRKKK